MRRNKVVVNYVAELIYNLFLVIIPLVLTPYTSRVLGAAGVGAYGYVQSITIYFISFASLGTSIYAQREIAVIRGDREKEYQIITDVLKIRIFLSGINAIALAVISLIYVQYRVLLLIQIIYIFAVAFDVTWYYYGIEKFVKVVFVFIISRIVSLVLTFTIVKNNADVWKYALIFALCELISKVVLSIPILKVFINNIRRKWIIGIRIKPILLLFVPQVANQIYTALDRTMIVAITGSEAENGYYEQGTKIVAFVNGFLVDALSFVMLPRVAKQFADNNKEMIKEEINLTFDYLCAIMWPLVFGIVGISKQLIPWFLGEEFLKSEILVDILAFNVIPVGIYTITGNQLLVPIGKHKEYAESIIIGVVTNITLNFCLIPKWGSVGACYASLISNTIIALYQMYHTRDYFSIWRNVLGEKKSIFASVIMFILLLIGVEKLTSSIGNTLLLVLLSVMIYVFIMIVLKDKMVLWIWNMLKSIRRGR